MSTSGGCSSTREGERRHGAIFPEVMEPGALFGGHGSHTFLGPMGLDHGHLTLQEDVGFRLCVRDLVTEVCSLDLHSLYTVCWLNGDTLGTSLLSPDPAHHPGLTPTPVLTHSGPGVVDPVSEWPQSCSF